MAFGEDEILRGNHSPSPRTPSKSPSFGSSSPSSILSSLTSLILSSSFCNTSALFKIGCGTSDIEEGSKALALSPVDIGRPLAGSRGTRDDPTVDEEMDDSDYDNQVFEDHEEVCRRLERRLGLHYYPDRLEEDPDDWKELATFIGSRYLTDSQFCFGFAQAVTKQNVSPSALLLCLVYIERIQKCQADLPLSNALPSSELFIVSLMTACKFLYDVGEMGDCYNGSWARQLKIPVRRLNQLEATFLNVLQWNLQCSACEFDCMVHKVEAGIVHHGCQFRSFLTYADLLVLCQSPNGSSAEILLDLVKQLMKMLAAVTAVYLCAGVLTLTAISLGPFMLQMANRPNAPSSKLDSSFAFFDHTSAASQSWMLHWNRTGQKLDCLTADGVFTFQSKELYRKWEKPFYSVGTLRKSLSHKLQGINVAYRGGYVSSVF